MKLNYKIHGSGEPLIILHGLFGTLDNWTTLGKQFGEHYEVYLVDQRNHGRSPHSDDFNYALMADDLANFIEEHGLEKPHILGHSMGGKTSMNFAVQHPDGLGKLIVVDIAPKTYPVHHQQIIDGLYSLDFSQVASRKMADETLQKSISDFGTRQFLLKNLERNNDGSYRWRMNLDAISEHIEEIGFGLDSSEIYEGDTLFIRGTRSNYIADEDTPVLNHHFPNNRLHSVENVGHWVHAEAPKELLEVSLGFLAS